MIVITKDRLHPDLQSLYGPLRVFSWLFSKSWFMRFSDWLGRRFSEGKDIDGLHCEQRHVLSSDGAYEIRTRIYRPVAAADDLPILLYIHGGGYITGFPETSHQAIERFVATRPCVVVAPDYRKAWTEPFPAGLNDCYDVLLWAQQSGAELGARGDALMVAGHSAGGGLTAAVTLRARDEGVVRIAFQMPIYPMIDDGQPDDPERAISTPVWDTELNRKGWDAYLADVRRRGDDVPAYAAPARNRDYAGFPPTITFVGDCEPFYWETCAYVEALRAADVEVAFAEYEGCFHAFDFMGKGVSDSALDFTYDRFAEFYDRAFVAASVSPEI